MANFVVAHCRKLYKAAGLRNVAVHNCRQAVYDRDLQVLDKPDYIQHPELRKHNEGDRPEPEAVLKRRNDRIREADLTRKPKKDAATAIEVVVTASPEWFADRSPKEVKAFFADARKALTDRFGADNLLQWNTHWDETTPHMHVLFVPIMATEKGNKYTSSEFLGGRRGLGEFQEMMFQKVGKRYGLERGIEGSKARHKDQYDRARELKEQQEELERQKRELLEQQRAIDLQQAELFEGIKVINAKMAALTEREQDKVIKRSKDIYNER